MTYLATITGKRQLTIPVKIYRQMKMNKGQKVVVKASNGLIQIEPAVGLVERMAGSIKLPEKYKGMEINKIIKKAKSDYFKKKGKV